MKQFKIFHQLIFTACLWMILAVPEVISNSHAADQKAQIVFLLRHAEKANSSSDSDLSSAGHIRAAALAHLLRNANIKQVHSTEFIRTMKTAEPVARHFGLEVKSYNPDNLPKLVARLRSNDGPHVVVGHSDTTPNMVKLLGGEQGPPIEEMSEFDRLYIVIANSDSVVSTLMVRYGNPQSGQ